MAWLTIMIANSVVFAFSAGTLARQKNRNALKWSAVTFLFIFNLAVIAALPPLRQDESDDAWPVACVLALAGQAVTGVFIVFVAGVDVSGFLAMGGYAPYVWASYGLAALLLVGLLLTSIQSLRSHEQTLKLLEAAQGERRRRRTQAVGTGAEEGAP